ncbi:response regulator transcription factor [Halopelagius longus]|uniref:Response regulator n=1 Tax=Halopelagius longus TaxID=1236180 RepID=A0A1H1B293_9EURY|nr:response regulator [Halopelagius longus]RDI70597.1 response regulator [Halopelagius longus]SDQ45566.1 Response regulator receiver domain-containing protein [Halopelagius longus]
MTDSPDGTPTDERTVLVADDEAALTDSLAVWLSDEYAVRTAYSGREAIDAYDSTVDAVVLDRRMPGLSGEQVFERLRDRPGDTRVALLTATDPDFSREDGDAPQFDEYLTKPATKEEVLAAVERLLERSSPSRSG